MSTSTTRRERCAGSKLALTDTVPSAGDPFHHYTATCPVCDRTFLLPNCSLPVHYVNVPIVADDADDTTPADVLPALPDMVRIVGAADAPAPTFGCPCTCHANGYTTCLGCKLAHVPTFTASAGHIAIVNGYEYYAVGGHVYMAPTSAPICDVRNNTRIGRWECSLEHWRAYDRLATLQRIYGALVNA